MQGLNHSVAIEDLHGTWQDPVSASGPNPPHGTSMPGALRQEGGRHGSACSVRPAFRSFFAEVQRYPHDYGLIVGRLVRHGQQKAGVRGGGHGPLRAQEGQGRAPALLQDDPAGAVAAHRPEHSHDRAVRLEAHDESAAAPGHRRHGGVRHGPARRRGRAPADLLAARKRCGSAAALRGEPGQPGLGREAGRDGAAAQAHRVEHVHRAQGRPGRRADVDAGPLRACHPEPKAAAAPGVALRGCVQRTVAAPSAASDERPVGVE
mmetsp:Transcript_59338/g.186297  ORF Transcript_59338/g.186297 Transcript_59338/m.186297 type:complete len:263 (-) Transcript_59338:582-1370(-)